MRIVHCSDWHGDWQKLPHADLYVITGDMFDNYPSFEEGPTSAKRSKSNGIPHDQIHQVYELPGL